MAKKFGVPLDLGGNKGTNAANGSASTDLLTYGQIIDGTGKLVARDGSQLTNIPGNPTTGVIGACFDGGGALIAVGKLQDIVIPANGTITSWEILGDQSGSIQFDIWKAAYSAYPPVVGGTIVATAPPLVSSASKATSSTLTGWTTSVAAGDILRFKVTSVTSMTRALITLNYTRT